ncbi:MAG: nucleotidyltransferase domain-containing protein [Xanthobacteraceae bacterium]|jgi:predicted nucleotidyltransferase
MNKQDAIDILIGHQDELRALGVRHAALFGSVARGEAGRQSDLDIIIELAPDASLDIFAYVELKNFIAALFPGPVDVVNKDALKPYVRPPATADSIYAF